MPWQMERHTRYEPARKGLSAFWPLPMVYGCGRFFGKILFREKPWQRKIVMKRYG